MTRGMLFVNPRVEPADLARGFAFSKLTTQLPAEGPLSYPRPAGGTCGSDPQVRK